MDESILVTIRRACNLKDYDDSFDGQLIIYTNGVLFRLAQIGIGKPDFSISGQNEIWGDFIYERFQDLEAVKLYAGLSVFIIFDPPQNASILAMINAMISKCEVCLYMEAEANKEG